MPAVVKAFLRELIPPFVYRLRHDPYLETISYEDAAAKCGKGYDSEVLARIVREKSEAWLSTDQWKGDPSSVRLATAIGLARNGDTLNVLDYGGAAAGHYFTALKIFGESISLRWYVVETPSMARECRRNESDSLQYFTNRDDAVAELSKHGGSRLMFSSGTLQYVPDAGDFLRWITAQRFPHLALVRCELNELDRPTYGIQQTSLSKSGPSGLPDGTKDERVSYPVTICGRQSVIDALSVNYDITISTADRLHFFEQESRLFGFYCRLKAPTY